MIIKLTKFKIIFLLSILMLSSLAIPEAKAFTASVDGTHSVNDRLIVDDVIETDSALVQSSILINDQSLELSDFNALAANFNQILEVSSGVLTFADQPSISPGSVDSDAIADSSIDSNAIADATLSVDSAKIADASVGTRAIRNLNITEAKIADSSINGNKLANDAISTEKIQDNSILTANFADDSISADKITNNAVVSQPITAFSSSAGAVNSSTSLISSLGIIDFQNNSTKANIANQVTRLDDIVNVNVPRSITAGALNGSVNSSQINNGVTGSGFIVRNDGANITDANLSRVIIKDFLQFTPQAIVPSPNPTTIAGTLYFDANDSKFKIHQNGFVNLFDAPASGDGDWNIVSNNVELAVPGNLGIGTIGSTKVNVDGNARANAFIGQGSRLTGIAGLSGGWQRVANVVELVDGSDKVTTMTGSSNAKLSTDGDMHMSRVSPAEPAILRFSSTLNKYFGIDSISNLQFIDAGPNSKLILRTEGNNMELTSAKSNEGAAPFHGFTTHRWLKQGASGLEQIASVSTTQMTVGTVTQPFNGFVKLDVGGTLSITGSFLGGDGQGIENATVDTYPEFGFNCTSRTSTCNSFVFEQCMSAYDSATGKMARCEETIPTIVRNCCRLQ